MKFLRAGSLGLLWLACAAGAVPILIARPAHAQDDAVLKMARERFKEGVRYYDEKKYEDARGAFLQAYALKKHPAVLLNLAQSELHSGHVADAAKHFAQFLRARKETTPAERVDAEKGLSAAKTKVGEINVSVSQQAAEIFIDGKSVGLSPLPGPVYLAPGSHTIRAKKGSESASTSVAAMAGESSTATLNLSGSAPMSSAGGTTPSATGASPATGPEPAGATPAAEQANPESEQGASSEGREPFFEWFGHTPLAWVGGGLTLAGLGGGIGFAIASHTAYNNADAVANKIFAAATQDGINPQGLCTNLNSAEVIKTGRPGQYAEACSNYQNNVNAGDQDKAVSTIGFVVAGVAAAGTVTYYFIDSKSSHPSKTEASSGVQAAVVPIATPTLQGLSVIGRF